MVHTRPNNGTCWICVLSILLLELAWSLEALTPQLSTKPAAFGPTGFPQVDPIGALWCFAMQNPWPKMACHCMGQIFTCLPCAWQWHLLDIWHLPGCDHIIPYLFLLAVLGVLEALVPHGYTWLRAVFGACFWALWQQPRTYHCEYGCSQLISKHFVLRWTKHMLLKVTKGKGKAESYTKAFILKPWWLLLPRILGLKLTSLWLLEKFVTLTQCKALCADGTF